MPKISQQKTQENMYQAWIKKATALIAETPSPQSPLIRIKIAQMLWKAANAALIFQRVNGIPIEKTFHFSNIDRPVYRPNFSIQTSPNDNEIILEALKGSEFKEYNKEFEELSCNIN